MTKFWKMNVEKFTFSSIETWKPATSLQTNSFIRDFTGIRSSRLEVFCKKGVLRNFTKLTCHYFTTATHYLKLYWKMNSFKVTFQRLCINGKCILICKSIDWFLRKQPVRGVLWSKLFLKLEISKEITLNLSEIFQKKELIFSDEEDLPVTSLKKKHLPP